MYRVRTVFTGVAGSPWYSNIHFGSLSTTAAQCVDAVADFWDTTRDYMANEINWATEREVPTIDPATGLTTDVTDVAPRSENGMSTEEMLPPALQALVRLRTGFYFNGKQVVGKIYVPGLTVDTCFNGKIIAGLASVFKSSGEVMRDHAGSSLCVYSPTNNAEVTVSSVTVWDEFAVLRSRRD